MKAPAWFMAASIQRKLTLIGLLTSGLALLSVSLILTVKDAAEWRARTLSDLTIYASVVGANVASTMLFDDRKMAGETLSAFSAKPDIVHAAIHDKENREFAAYHAPGHTAHDMPLIGEGEHAYTWHSLIVSVPIRFKGETLGSISLESNLEGLYSGLLRNTTLTFLAAFGVFLLTVFFFARLQKVIVAPLLALSGAMQRVAEERNYGVRAVVFQQDEIGMLARTFNEMLERIQSRDAELAQHRERLEEEVGQRTADLREANLRLGLELVERRQAERALHDSEEKFRVMGSSAQDAIIMLDNEGRVSFWNAAAEKIFGYASAEISGKELHAALAPQRFHEAFRKGFEQFRGSGSGPVIGITLELPALRQGGEEFPIELSLSAVELAGRWNAIGIVRDITARRLAEAERRQLSEAFKQSQEAIVLADAALDIIYVNPGFTRLFGYASEEVIGRSLDLLAPPQEKNFLPARVAATARAAGAYHGEALRRAKDGRLIPVLLNVTPVLDEQGAVATYVGTMVDLSELKQAEAQALQRLAEISRANSELQQLNDKLEQAQGQLLQSEKMASIGVLAAGVAHEINNPIGYVGSNLESLKRYVADFLRLLDAYQAVQQSLPDESGRFAAVEELKRELDLEFLKQDVVGLLQESHQGIERVRKIVKDLKDFSHVDVEEKWMEDDLQQGLESTLNVIWNELKYKCEVKKEYAELPPVECMISQLNQVFMNLLVNAAQAIKERGTITIRTGRADERVWIEIADTGAGIPEENLKRIFDPFFTTKPVGKGTGLGLSVSYSIVQKHHGNIEVESEPGKGTTFRIWLPLKQPDGSADAPAVG